MEFQKIRDPNIDPKMVGPPLPFIFRAPERTSALKKCLRCVPSLALHDCELSNCLPCNFTDSVVMQQSGSRSKFCNS